MRTRLAAFPLIAFLILPTIGQVSAQEVVVLEPNTSFADGDRLVKNDTVFIEWTAESNVTFFFDVRLDLYHFEEEGTSGKYNRTANYTKDYTFGFTNKGNTSVQIGYNLTVEEGEYAETARFYNSICLPVSIGIVAMVVLGVAYFILLRRKKKTA